MPLMQKLRLWREQLKYRKGFTLLELLLVIAILAILFGIIASYVNIPSILLSAQDQERKHNEKQLGNALYARLVDKWSIPGTIPVGKANEKDICRAGVSGNPACVDLSDLIPDYIAKLPADPLSTPPGTGYKVYQENGRVFVAAAFMGQSGGGGGPPVNPIGTVAMGGTPRYVHAPGDGYLYVTNVGSILQVFDVTTPSSPQAKGTFDFAVSVDPSISALRQVVVSGNYAYVVNQGGSPKALHKIQLSADRMSFPPPFSSNNFSPPPGYIAPPPYEPLPLFSPKDVFVVGNYAYVVDPGDKRCLKVFDISGAGAPLPVGALPLHLASPVDTCDGVKNDNVFVTGNYAYGVSKINNTLNIYDVLNPASALSLTNLGANGAGCNRDIIPANGPFSVYVRGDYAYLVCPDNNTLRIFNVQTKASPSFVREISLSCIPSCITPYFLDGYGTRVYITFYDSNKLQVLDIGADATNPSVVTDFGTGANPYNLAVSPDGRYVYVANPGENNVQIFDMQGI